MKLWNPTRQYYSIVNFVKHHINGGFILMVMALLAMLVANSPWYELYDAVWRMPVRLQIGEFNLFSHHGSDLTFQEFINDALMAVFFLFVGLEIKRELLVGELSSVKKASLPIIVALGGIIVPVLVYFSLAHTSPESQGVAIPMATDIAFSLGILSLLGNRVPIGLKIFLTAFAVVDDIAGILVIAIGYSGGIDWGYLTLAFAGLTFLCILNRFNIYTKLLYILTGLIVWYAFLQSGIHSTIAGVLLAFTIPYTNKKVSTAHKHTKSMLHSFEKGLEIPVNYFIMPLFAFANAGVHLSGDVPMFGIVTWAVLMGLVVGKFIGLFSFTWIFTKLRIVKLPNVNNWKSIAGVCMLGGVGFTVSLFIANLSFAKDHPELLAQAKMGILLGTLISGVLGYTMLHLSLPHKKNVR